MAINTQPNNTGVLSLENVADELGCSVLHVKRLIFRNRLGGSVLQSRKRPGRDRIDASQIKILASDVARYVADGAEDFTAPAFVNGWLADAEYDYVYRAAGELQAACESQLLTDEQVTARFDRDGIRNYSVALKATSEVLEASKSAKKQVASGGYYDANLTAIVGRCRTWLRLVAVSRLRQLARDIIPEVSRMMDGRAGVIPTAGQLVSANPLDELYSGDYDTICSLALEKLKGYKAIAFSRTTHLRHDIDAATGIVSRHRDGWVTVSYSLPFSTIKFDKSLCDLAF